jgi:transaldolase
MSSSRGFPDATPDGRVRALHAKGVSVWLDDLSRALLESGTLERYLTDHALSGVTSNPTIFAHALRSDDRYQDRLQRLVDQGLREPHALFFALALSDVHDAAQLLRDTYERSAGRDGYVSFECTPDVAHDAAATVRQAEHVWDRVDAPNLMIKVPATPAGIEAIERLTAEGINVNVTLLFATGRYEQASRAYQRGIERRVRAGEPVDRVRSVASVFVSRIDALVAQRLGEDAGRGSVAIANARSIYARATAIFDEPQWREMSAVGASWQRPLWASTAPKTLGLRDVAYVEALALPDTIVTVPEKTLLAFADHGVPRLADGDGEEHAAVVAQVGRAGVDLEAIGAELESAGLRAFTEAYAEVIDHITAHVAPQNGPSFRQRVSRPGARVAASRRAP